MGFKIDWASLIVRSKFTVFALFYFVFEGNFPSTSPRGAYIWRGDLTEGVLRYRFGGLIFGGAYFQNFTVVFALPSANRGSVDGIRATSTLKQQGEKLTLQLAWLASPYIPTKPVKNHLFKFTVNDFGTADCGSQVVYI